MRFNKIIIPYFIFFIAIIMTIFNSGYEVHFSNLDGKYLIKSIEFYEFGEWSFFKRGPIYTLLISIGFYLFGVNFEIAIWISLIFYIGSIILLYFISKDIFNEWVGLFSSLYALLSIPLFKASFDIDPGSIMSFFVLFSIFLYLQYLKKQNYLNLFFSSFFLGIAMLTKEAALFFIIYPIVLSIFIKEYKKYKKIFFELFYFYIIFFITLLPWLIFIFLNDKNPILIFGEFLPSGGANIGLYTNDGFINFVYMVIFKGIPKTIYTLFKYEPFFILAILGVILSFYKLIIGEKEHKTYIALIVVTLPVFAAYGIYLDGYRQLISQLLILYISIGYISYFFIKLNYVYIILGVILISISIVTTYIINFDKLKNYNIKNIINERITGKLGIEINSTGRMNNEILVLSKWINNNISFDNTSLLVGGVYDDTIKYLTKLKYDYQDNTPKFYELEYLINNNITIDDKIFEITSLKTFKSSQKRYRQFFVLFEKDVKKFINHLIKTKNNHLFIFASKKTQDKVIFPKLLNLINRHSQYSYNLNGISVISKFNNIDLKIEIEKDVFANGTLYSENLNWLDTVDNLSWLSSEYEKEFEDTKEYLQKYNIYLD